MIRGHDTQRLGASLRALRSTVAREVSDLFFEAHPEWLTRYGAVGRERTVEDAGHHLDFLGGALESGSVTAFEDYTAWACRVLVARNIPAHLLARTLELIPRALARHVEAQSLEAVEAMIQAGLAVCERHDHGPPAHDASPLGLSARMFVQAVLGGRRAAAVTVVHEALRDGHPVLDVYVEIVQQALYEVGRLWESNRITVAEEHAATALTQYVLARMYAELPLPTVQRGKLLITGVAGELHQIGANLVADVLESAGFNVRFLGTNLPTSGILGEVEAHVPAILGISATVLSNVPEVTRLVEEVRARFGAASPAILLGGSAFGGLPHRGRDFASRLGAIGVAADVREALSIVSAAR